MSELYGESPEEIMIEAQQIANSLIRLLEKNDDKVMQQVISALNDYLPELGNLLSRVLNSKKAREEMIELLKTKGLNDGIREALEIKERAANSSYYNNNVLPFKKPEEK